MDEQVYHPERAARLVVLLRALAARISALSDDAALLAAGPELLKMMGDARSELFHYEVRATYDTPEVAESRRIVEEARRQGEAIEFEGPNDEEDEPWRNG
jgi:predicted DNA-binding transcriptional regulator YafY